MSDSPPASHELRFLKLYLWFSIWQFLAGTLVIPDSSGIVKALLTTFILKQGWIHNLEVVSPELPKGSAVCSRHSCPISCVSSPRWPAVLILTIPRIISKCLLLAAKNLNWLDILQTTLSWIFHDVRPHWTISSYIPWHSGLQFLPRNMFNCYTTHIVVVWQDVLETIFYHGNECCKEVPVI